jgi:hypothetical protein
MNATIRSALELDIHSSQLTELPADAFTQYSHLIKIDCSGNRLTRLPELPDSLKILYCSCNRLTRLPALPPHLERLECMFNELADMPILPDSLKYLNCDCNLPYPNYNLREIRAVQRFKRSYYTAKCRARLVSWMWRSCEAAARREGHPDRIWEWICEGDGELV